MDGAKRDRLVWPGDIAISGPSMFVSTNSLDGIKNGLAALFSLQQSNGRLSYNGIGYFISGHFDYSFTYHLYTLLDLYYYYTYSGDLDFLQKYWAQYKLGIANTMGLIDSSGMANVDSPNDWLRSGMGGHNVEVCLTLLSQTLFAPGSNIHLKGQFNILSHFRNEHHTRQSC